MPRQGRRRALAAIGTALGIGLAGCSGDGTDQGDSTSTQETTSTTSSTTPVVTPTETLTPTAEPGTDSRTPTPTPTPTPTLTPYPAVDPAEGRRFTPDTSEAIGFGFSVSLSEQVAVVGAPSDDRETNANGSVFVFRRNGSGWTRETNIVAAGDGNTGFGQSVDYANGTLIAGSPLEFDNTGVVRIYERSDGEWNRTAAFPSEQIVERERNFGAAVAVAESGDLAAGGMPLRQVGESERSGYVRLLRRVQDGWTRGAILAVDESDEEGNDNDRAGAAVDISDGRVLVGAPGATVGASTASENISKAGVAHVFGESGGEWSRETTLSASDADEGDQFGTSVALDGDIALVGAPFDEDPNGNQAGSAYVFRRSGSGWTQQAKLVPEDGDSGDRFGLRVALSDRTAVVTSVSDEDPNGSRAGSAYVFGRGSDGWAQRAKFSPGDVGSGAFFGSGVALSGSEAIVGASGAGAAFLFEL